MIPSKLKFLDKFILEFKQAKYISVNIHAKKIDKSVFLHMVNLRWVWIASTFYVAVWHVPVYLSVCLSDRWNVWAICFGKALFIRRTMSVSKIMSISISKKMFKVVLWYRCPFPKSPMFISYGLLKQCYSYRKYFKLTCFEKSYS